MAETVQAWKSVDGVLFATEDEANRHNTIEAAAAIIAPPIEGFQVDQMDLLRRSFTRAAIADLYDKCGWRPVS